MSENLLICYGRVKRRKYHIVLNTYIVLCGDILKYEPLNKFQSEKERIKWLWIKLLGYKTQI